MSFLGGTSRGARRASSLGVLTTLIVATLLMSDAAFTADIHWASPVDGSWNNAANWNPQQVPTAGDNVFIDAFGASSYAVTLDTSPTINSLTLGLVAFSDTTGKQTLNVNGQTLTLATASVVESKGILRMLGGTVTGPGAISVLGEIQWYGGTMSGSGTTTIEPLGKLNIGTAEPLISENTKYLTARVIQNNGTLTWIADTWIYGASGGTIQNAATMTVTNNNAPDYGFYGAGTSASGVLINTSTGTIAHSGTGRTRLYNGIRFDNTGSVDVSQGSMTFESGGTSSGSFTAQSGATLGLGGFAGSPALPQTLSGALSGAGTFAFMSGTVDVGGSYAVTATTISSGAAANFNVASSTVSFDQSSGTLGGTGTFTISGSGSWTGGTMAGSGSTVIGSGATFALSGNTVYLDTRTLSNGGTMTWSGSSWIYGQNGAVLENAASFTITNGAGIWHTGTGAAPVFNNLATGSIVRTGAGTTTQIYPNMPFNNLGSVTVTDGTFGIDGGGSSSGSFTATAPGTLRFGSSGTRSLVSGSSVGGTGTVRFSGGTTTVGGTYALTGTGTTIVEGGTVTFGAASTPALTVVGGIMEANGAFTVAGAFTFNGGTLKGTGTTTIQSSATSAILNAGGSPIIDGHTLILQANTSLGGSAYAYNLNVINGAVVQNSATFTIVDDAYIYGYGTPAPQIQNGGTFQKSGGTGESWIYPEMQNTGAVSVTSGILALYGGGSGSGTYTATAPGTLRFSGSKANTLGATSAVAGTGTVRFSGGAVSIGGTYALTGTGLTVVEAGAPTFGTASSPALTLSGGTMEVTAAFSVSGAFTFNSGTLKGAGITTVLATGSAAFLNAGGSPSIDGHTLVLQADATLGGAGYAYNLTVINGGVLQNNATFTILDDAYIYGYGTPAPRVDNAGTFRKTGGTGDSYIYPAFNNTGTAEVSAGLLSIYGGGTSSGAFAATAPGTLRFGNGTSALAAASSVTGTGTVRFTGGTTSIGGTYALTGGGLTLVDGGIASLAAASTPNLTITNGTLEATAALTVSGAFAFNGGTLKGAGATTILASGSASLATAGYPYLDVHTLVLEANTTFGGGTYSYYLNMSAGSVVQNGGTFTIVDDSYIYGYGTPAPRIDNSGTFAKSGGTGTSAIYAAMNNNGTVVASAATLGLHGGGSGPGTYTATAPGTLAFGGGTHTLTGTIGGDGTIQVSSGTVNASGTFASTGLTSLTYGDLSLTMASASMQNLDLAGGTLGGSAQVNVGGTMNWTAGALSGTEIVQVAASPAALTISGTQAKYMYGATLRNGAASSWSGSGWLYANQGAKFENLAGATLTRTDTGAFYYYCCTGAAPLFDNQAGATFVRNGSGTTYDFYSANVTNAGTMNVAAGTLGFYLGTFTQTAGTFSIASGASVASSASFDIQGGALLGAGTFTGNLVNSGGAIMPGASPGALTIDGNYTQGASGSLDVELGGVTAGTEFDQLNVSGTASLGGTLNVTLISPYAPADGSSYRILTFGTLAPSPNNAFATTNGTDLGAGNALQVSAGATFIDLVTNGNASPAAVADTASTAEDVAVSISVLANDSDPDGNTLTISGFTPATYGAAGCGTTTCTYTPNANYFGSDSFTYTVTDGFTSSTATVTIAVTSVNDPPVASADAATTAANAPVTINVLANDSDIDGGVLSVTGSTNGTLGSVSCTAAGACTYTPSGTAGADSFTYTVSDGAGGQTTGTVTVTVQAAVCPSPITLLAPGSGAQVEGSGTLSWSGGSGADLFKVYLGPSGSGCTTLLGTTTATEFAYSGLAPGEYTWKVIAEKSGCEVPAQSSCAGFTVADPCPKDAPILAAPDAGAEVAPEVEFSWTAVPNALRYRLILFTAATGLQERAIVAQPSEPLPTTLSATVTAPLGSVLWWVVADFPDGCPSVQSADRVLTVVKDCPAGTPEPLEPLETAAIEETPVIFRWTPVAGTVRYELFLSINGSPFQSAGRADGSAVDPSLPAAVPAGASLAWYVEAEFPEGCGVATSRTVPVSVSCFPPVLSLQGEVTTDKPYQVRATIVSVGVSYVFQESLTADFGTVNAEKEGFVDPTGAFVFAEFEHSVAEPRPFYYRVKLDQQGCAFSDVGRIVVVPLPPPTSTETETVVQFGNEEEIRQPLFIPSPTPDLQASYTYLATTDREWMRVEPPGGTVGPGGVTVEIITNPVGLPVGTNTGTVTLTFISLSGGKSALETTPTATSTPVSVTLVTPVTNKGKEGPNAESLIIPAVAHATGVNSEWQTDVRIVNLGSDKRKYQLLWTSTATDATLAGKNCELELAAGQSAALDDIVKQWYGLGSLPGEGAQGVLEIRPLGASGPGKGAAGVPVTRSLVSLASSRMYNRTPQGTLGEFIPAIPFAAFVGGSAPENGKKSVLSLQQLAQSSAYRTNIGVSEASGNPVSLEMRFFDADGTKILTVPVDLRSGEHRQFNQILAMNGLTNVAAARAEVEVVSGNGKITAYASVVDNVTGDPLQVHAVDLAKIGARKYVMPGVAHFDTGQARWRTDVQMFNAGLASVSAQVAFFPVGASAPTKTATVQVDPGTIRTLSDIVPTLFGESNTGGAVQIATAASSELVITGRTYDQRESGSYGQFMAAVTEDDAIGLGDRAMQVLQLEQSNNMRSNLGIVEVSGKEVRVELSAFPAESRVTPRVELTLKPNEFRQLNQVLKSLNAGTTYNARIALRVVGGDGRIVAYGSTVDNMTQDPTFIPGQ